MLFQRRIKLVRFLAPPDRPGTAVSEISVGHRSSSSLETTYDIRVKSNKNITFVDDHHPSPMHLSIFGENGSAGAIELHNDDGDRKKYDGQSTMLRKKAFDAGKVLCARCFIRHSRSNI